MAAPTVLILPGWQGSGPGHWQMRWADVHGYRVVEQSDWLHPRRGDWLARLDEVVIDTPGEGADIVLVAHCLACIQVAAWASVSRHTARIRAALLVAPGDVERADWREHLPGWAPIERERLPFAAHVVASSNDPFMAPSRAQALAHDWGAACSMLESAGHIHADSGLGDWPQGHAWLLKLFSKQER